MTPIISAQNVTKTLSGEVPVTLVNNVSVEIGKGEFVTITGPSGSGKSSLLYILGLLDTPTNGKVFLDNIDTSKLNDTELANLRISKIGFVFQFHFLIPEFNAIENVMLPMKRLGRLKEQEMESTARVLLRSLGLENEINKRPKQLSGGQSQRVAIARALANKPLVILADEPTGNLDTKATANVQEIFRDLAKNSNTSIVTVTHDPTFAEKSDRIITVTDGKLAKI